MNIYQGLKKSVVVKILLNEVAALKELGCSWDFMAKQLNTNTGQNFNAEILRKSFSRLRHNIDEGLKNKLLVQFRDTIELKQKFFLKVEVVENQTIQENYKRQSAHFVEIHVPSEDAVLKADKVDKLYFYDGNDAYTTTRPFLWIIEAVQRKLENNDSCSTVFIPDGRVGYETEVIKARLDMKIQKLILKGIIKSWEDVSDFYNKEGRFK